MAKMSTPDLLELFEQMTVLELKSSSMLSRSAST